jgi:hypothetical protein
VHCLFGLFAVALGSSVFEEAGSFSQKVVKSGVESEKCGVSIWRLWVVFCVENVKF